MEGHVMNTWQGVVEFILSVAASFTGNVLTSAIGAGLRHLRQFAHTAGVYVSMSVAFLPKKKWDEIARTGAYQRPKPRPRRTRHADEVHQRPLF